jgi:DNA invertase Pin-like site-specific DNA recombinase
MPATTRRAIGVVRVSQMKGRDEASIPEQKARIEQECQREGLRLLDVFKEPDVSGFKTPLDRREGLTLALEAVQAGRAEVVVGGYFDRLFRNYAVQREFVERVEAADGDVLSVDFGKVSNGSAATWLSSGMMGLVAEFYARQTAEKTLAGVQAAIDKGHPPWPAQLGYRKLDKGLVPDPETRSLREQMLRLRVAGTTVAGIRDWLRDEHGIAYSVGHVGKLLAARDQLGELHFGDFRPNLEAWEPIVDRGLWQAAQRVRVARGRKPKSDRLLARLGVLVCGTCGSKMSIGVSTTSGYRFYRCVNPDCGRRVAISAEIIEGVVVDAVREHLHGVEGRASAEHHARRVERAAADAQAELDALIRLLDPLEPAAAERLREATAKRDAAQEQVDRLPPTRTVRTVSVADWDDLSLDARRELIRATVDRATVAPGRGDDRITIEFLGE